MTTWDTYFGTPPYLMTTYELGCIAIRQIEKLRLREGPPWPRIMQPVRD